MQLNVCSSAPFPNLSCNASSSWQIVILLLFLGKLIIFKFVSVLFLRKRMCIILSLTENYYFIKISAHLHYVRKLLEFKVLWECRSCADFRGWRQKFVNRMLFLLYDFSSFHYDSYGISTEYQWYLCDMALWRTSFSGERVRFTDKWDLYLSAQCLHESKHVDIQWDIRFVQICRYSFKLVGVRIYRTSIS